MEDQRRANNSRIWWERFEWVAERVASTGKDSIALPYHNVLNTIRGLNDSTQDPTQKAMIEELTDLAVTRHETRGVDDATDHPNPNRRPIDARTLNALRNLLRATENTPAHSERLQAQLYEYELGEALKRLVGEHNVLIGESIADQRVDFIIAHNGTKLLIDAKYTNARKLLSSTQDRLGKVAENFGAHGALIVSPSPLKISNEDPRLNVRTATWGGKADDKRLFDAIQNAVNFDHQVHALSLFLSGIARTGNP